MISANRLLNTEQDKIKKRHKKKLDNLSKMKAMADKIDTNPNEEIVNLSGQDLSPEQIEVLKLGLRHGLATRPNSLEMMAVSEDLYDQLGRLHCWKEGYFVKDKVKNSLRSFTYNCLDLDLSQYYTDRKIIRTLSNMPKTLCTLKPDKGNGVVVLKRSDYIKSLNSIFNNTSKFIKLDNDPTFTRLTTLQNYLSTLRNRGEISETEYKFLRPKSASFGRAHGLPKIHKHFDNLPSFRPIVDTTTTAHYNIGKFVASL